MRRDAKAQLELELVGDPFLTPSWIIACDLGDQLLEILRQRRTTSLSRFPAPPRAERGPMPFEERVWFGDDQGVAPIEETARASMASLKVRVVLAGLAFRSRNRASCLRRK
jgi:hypothetical protein